MPICTVEDPHADGKACGAHTRPGAQLKSALSIYYWLDRMGSIADSGAV
jgi:hypothetical protein